MRAIAALSIGCLVAGCSLLSSPSLSPIAWGDRVATPAPEAEVNRAVLARGPETLTLMPISPRGAVIGTVYGYDMPHCGISSPIDVDGSFWDAIGVAPDSVDFDGRPGTFRLTDGGTAVFTTAADGKTLQLVRHEGPKEFRLCM